MAKYVSHCNPVSVASLKRKPAGSVVVRHWGTQDVKFKRVHGGWSVSERSVVVSSAAVAAECNSAVGCKESWAKVY